MSEFYSAYNRPAAIPAPDSVYDHLVPTYHEKVVDGFTTLVHDGYKDIYEMIQSHADEADIEAIVNRLTLGDYSDVRNDGRYIDVSDMPKSLAEAQNLILCIREEFGSLPADVRDKFGNSVERYVEQYGTETWANHLGYVKSDAPERKEDTPIEQKQ